MLPQPSAGLWGRGRSRSQACWLAAPLPSGPPWSVASLSTVLAKSSARAVTALLTIMPGVGRSLYKALSQACLSAFSPSPRPLRPPRPAPRRYTTASCQPLLPRMSSRPLGNVPSGGQGRGGCSCVFIGKPERRAAQPRVGPVGAPLGPPPWCNQHVSTCWKRAPGAISRRATALNMASHVVLVSGQCREWDSPMWHVPCLHVQERRVARGQAQLGSLLRNSYPKP